MRSGFLLDASEKSGGATFTSGSRATRYVAKKDKECQSWKFRGVTRAGALRSSARASLSLGKRWLATGDDGVEGGPRGLSRAGVFSRVISGTIAATICERAEI